MSKITSMSTSHVLPNLQTFCLCYILYFWSYLCACLYKKKGFICVFAGSCVQCNSEYRSLCIIYCILHYYLSLLLVHSGAHLSWRGHRKFLYYQRHPHTCMLAMHTQTLLKILFKEYHYSDTSAVVSQTTPDSEVPSSKFSFSKSRLCDKQETCINRNCRCTKWSKKEGRKPWMATKKGNVQMKRAVKACWSQYMTSKHDIHKNECI